MDQNLEKSFNTFSIENTMDMGMGDSQLLNDLMSPETSTSNPDDVEEIVKTVEEKNSKPEYTPKKIKEIKGDENGDENNKKLEKNPLEDFFSSDDDDEEEDNEEIDSVDVKSKETKSEEDNVPEVSQFSALANDLLKLGVFTKEEDEENFSVNSPEEFLERFNSEKKKGAIQVVNDFIGQFGEDYQQAFDAIYVKGVNPKEYFNSFNSIQNFKDLELSGDENEDNQITVIKQALFDQGFEPEDIDTEVERLKNYGDLESVAMKHHKVLIKKETAKLQQLEQQSQLQLQQKNQIKNQYISNVQSVLQEKLKTKEFDGIPLNPKLANELQDFLLVDKYKTASGETLTDFDKTILELKRPENHELKVKVGLLLKVLEKDPTLSTIQKSGVTKKSTQLFGNLAKQVTTDRTFKKENNKPTSWFQ